MSIPSPGPGVRYMSEEDSFVSCQRRPANTLAKSIDWKQGLIIAMGVPILILPSLYDISGSVWAFSIVIWTVSVIQGFLQNMAIGEMAAALEVPGIGACAQRVFNNPQKYKGKKYNLGKFVGAFCAWSYWFTWTPVIPIFTITAGAYLQEFIEPLAGVNSTLLNLVLGFIYSHSSRSSVPRVSPEEPSSVSSSPRSRSFRWSSSSSSRSSTERSTPRSSSTSSFPRSGAGPSMTSS